MSNPPTADDVINAAIAMRQLQIGNSEGFFQACVHSERRRAENLREAQNKFDELAAEYKRNQGE